MTFVVVADSKMDSRRRYPTMNGSKQPLQPPPRQPPPIATTAVVTTQEYRQPLGPKNSLDYWQKAKDHQGVTYYWNPSANPYYGMESIYAQQKPRSPQRPAPFPLSIPPQPAQIKPRAPPSAMTTTTTLPVYHNVPPPSLPTAAVASPAASVTMVKLNDDVRLNGHLNSRSDVGGYGPKRPQPLVWTVQTEQLRELRTTPPRSYPVVAPTCG